MKYNGLIPIIFVTICKSDVTKVTTNVTELCEEVLNNISREETGLIEWKSTTSWSKWDPDICFNSAKCVLCQSSKIENHFPSSSENIKYCSSPKDEDCDNKDRYPGCGVNYACKECGRSYHDCTTFNCTAYTGINPLAICQLYNSGTGCSVRYNVTQEQGSKLIFIDEDYTSCNLLDRHISIYHFIVAAFCIMGSFLLVFVVFISHQSYFIKHCPCHTRFSCFRVTHYLCSCCPRNYFSQNCMKDRNKPYKKYQHIDEDRQNLNNSQVPLSSDSCDTLITQQTSPA